MKSKRSMNPLSCFAKRGKLISVLFVCLCLITLTFGSVAVADDSDSSITPHAAGDQFQFEVTVSSDDLTFSVPTSSFLGGSYGKTFAWDIDWGDGDSLIDANSSTYPNSDDSPGISHAYPGAGTYVITITPNASGPADAWFGSFGFSPHKNEGASVAENKEKVTKVISPIVPSMTRDAANAAVDYEWHKTFNGCTSLTMSDGFTFDPVAWAGVTTAGDEFCSYMFSSCNDPGFTMGEAFNLPADFTAVGEIFAYGMFMNCFGDSFTMNEIFNLPQGITSADYFANDMFFQAGGPAFQVNDVFTFPSGIVVSGSFDPFFETFSNMSPLTPPQYRSVESIINGNDTPDYVDTFYDSPAFLDLGSIGEEWGGEGKATYAAAFNAWHIGVEYDDTTVPVVQDLNIGDKIAQPSEPPVSTNGYLFGGWYKDRDCTTLWDFDNDVIAGDTVLIAKWSAVIAPSEPQNIKAVAGDSSVKLTWEAPLDDGGSAITGYAISIDAGTTWIDAGLVSEYNYTGLQNGTSYTFLVRAANTAGVGNSTQVSATPVKKPEPVPPTPDPVPVPDPTPLPKPLPSTGDSFPLFACFGIVGMAAASLVLAIFLRKRKSGN